MGARISQHNSRIIGKKSEELTCNCRDQCPFPGKCRTDKVIYRATVETNDKVETYVGITAGEFKKRYQKHTSDFTNHNTKNATTLSTYIWKLREENVNYETNFEIVGRAAPFSPVSGICNLCVSEKYEIIFNPQTASLNSRNELFSACRHRWQALLIKKKRKARDRGS